MLIRSILALTLNAPLLTLANPVEWRSLLGKRSFNRTCNNCSLVEKGTAILKCTCEREDHTPHTAMLDLNVYIENFRGQMEWNTR
jgi:hypothetical protein